MKARVTGSGGLIGSECARTSLRGARQFFGPAGTTAARRLVSEGAPGYTHRSIDVRTRQTVRDFFAYVCPDFIIRTAVA